MAPVETEYYDLLGVPVDADDNQLKKGYRKAAMKYHPDKNHSADAEEKFKDISKAYQVLADPNLRAVYDKNGKAMTDKEGGLSMDDAAGFFANVFGGERFHDYIGEISIMKDMTEAASTMMTDEEKAEIEKQLNPDKPSTPPVAGEQTSAIQHDDSHNSSAVNPPSEAPGASPSSRPEATTQPSGSSSLVVHGEHVESTSRSPSNSINEKEKLEKEREAVRKRKAEQKEKLREQEKERRKVMEARVSMLTTKMIDRLRPFVDAKHPGDKDDPETLAFEAKMKREVEDLKLESFGVELLHTIGNVYMMKATSFLKSRKFLGIPGFFSRLKEKGTLAKDVWGVIGSALSVRDTMLEMEKLQAKGDVDEAELKALEMDVTGKIMLASWRGARLEVIQVLREVVDNVLKEPGASETVLFNRAKGLMLMGAIFKAAEPDESDEERRELERRMVAEAAQPKPKPKGGKGKDPRHAPHAKETLEQKSPTPEPTATAPVS
ncbi:X-domain of DnaJ-containing-domain-containing protein [Lentinula guzmanii]|uniref:X-domain of DnaJ-containing-domain-containing protein n=1 Tax=Lentinula guzmanii TaxID=2804957 RepID=A0AA38J4W2_9AGAR|nr:X-domain of DnaJ-containing-domain-containing protein [Lentinula guzmanii]